MKQDKPLGGYVTADGMLYVDLTEVRNARRNPDGSVLLGQTAHAVLVEPGPDADAICVLFGLKTQ